MNLTLQQQREIRELLATGNRDQVVKRYREITGAIWQRQRRSSMSWL